MIKRKSVVKKEVEGPVTRYVMRCQGERLYLGEKKDCGNCEQRFFCYTHRTSLYVKGDVVFANNEEDAEAYFDKGFGIELRVYEMNLEEYERILNTDK